MDEIVLISDGKGRNNQLVRLVKELFPECNVTVSSRKKQQIKKVDKKGFQYAENPEAR